MSFEDVIAMVTYGLPEKVTDTIQRYSNEVVITDTLDSLMIKLGADGNNVKVEVYFHDMWSDQQRILFYEKGISPDEEYLIDLNDESDIASSIKKIKNIIINGY
jgi:hypothetical protein